MSYPDKASIIMKFLLSGYNEENFNDEQFLLESLRKTEANDEYRAICLVLGKSGGLFCVPTLMALSLDKNLAQSIPAINAMAEIRSRVIEDKNFKIDDFFSPSYWKPRWVANKEKFISYVALLSNIFDFEDPLNGNNLDSTAEKLLKEITVDLYPYETFRELRLCTPGWEAKDDFYNLIESIESDSLMEKIFDKEYINKDEGSLLEDNIINMKCDFLLTRLKWKVEYKTFHYLLKIGYRLNELDTKP